MPRSKAALVAKAFPLRSSHYHPAHGNVQQEVPVSLICTLELEGHMEIVYRWPYFSEMSELIQKQAATARPNIKAVRIPAPALSAWVIGFGGLMGLGLPPAFGSP